MKSWLVFILAKSALNYASFFNELRTFKAVGAHFQIFWLLILTNLVTN